MAYRRAIIQTIVRLSEKFAVGDTVRFIGTDTLLTARQYDKATHEFEVQRDDDDASPVWVLGIYLERVQIACAEAAD